MALAYAEPVVRDAAGGRWLTTTVVTLDNSYPTGGYTLDPTKLGLTGGQLDVAIAGRARTAAGATSFGCDIVGGKLQLYGSGTVAKEAFPELANATDVHTLSVVVTAVGR